MTAVVRVYCQDEGHRRQGERDPLRRSEVCEFRRDEESGCWLDVPGEAALTNHRKAQPRAAGPRVLGARLKHVAQFAAPPGAQRYDLRCELCKRTVPARAEKLQPVLDLLAARGVSEISLEHLAPRL